MKDIFTKVNELNKSNQKKKSDLNILIKTKPKLIKIIIIYLFRYISTKL